jgi:hypothetical protein
MIIPNSYKDLYNTEQKTYHQSSMSYDQSRRFSQRKYCAAFLKL